jgi:hypothetical protein
MKPLTLKAIEEAFKTLKCEPPIISVDNGYVTIRVDTGWLIISEEKFNNLKNKELC